MDITTQRTCVLVAADEPLLRFGIRKVLETEQRLTVIGEATNMSEAAGMVRDLKPDILLLDVSTCEGAVTAIRRLVAIRPGTRTIVIVSSVENGSTTEVLASGASGVIARGSTIKILLDCVRAVLAGRVWYGKGRSRPIPEESLAFPVAAQGTRSPNGYGLTPRELDVIGTIVDGCSNKDVGKKFSISERTVKHHLTNIYQKLEISGRLELALFAMDQGLGRSQSELPSSVQPRQETQRLDEREHPVSRGLNERTR